MHQSLYANLPASDVLVLATCLRVMGLANWANEGCAPLTICDTQVCCPEALNFMEVSMGVGEPISKITAPNPSEGNVWHLALYEAQGFLVLQVQCDVSQCAGEVYYYAASGAAEALYSLYFGQY